MRYIAPLFIACFLCAPLFSAERPPEIETLLPGVRLSMIAEHPDLATPTGVDVDEQGRIWAVATHTHFRPDDYVGPNHDEILVFTPQGDGKRPLRRVFYNATTATMDLELGENGWVYLAERGQILRIKDSNGNGQADLVESVVKLATEADYPHNGLEGLAWDPQGNLVFGLGENYGKAWTLSGPDGASVTGTGEGGVFRCAADGKHLRRIARGFWNPFGICVRDDGEIFAAENDPGERPPCRLLHVVEGGDYGYQRTYGPEAHHPFVAWNGELRATLPMLHPVGEAPCGVLPLGNGLITPSWSDHRVDYFQLRRQGATFAAEPVTLLKGSRYFRPSCIARDRSAKGDQAVFYLCDWVDGRYQAHGYGRLWRLEIDLKQSKWIREPSPDTPNKASRLAADLRSGAIEKSREELFDLAQHDDPFLAQAALLALSRQAKGWNASTVSKWPPADRVTALLAIKQSKSPPEKWVEHFLTDSDPAVAFETLRWIADAQLKRFLPEVEKQLQQSDLNFQQFEAAVATWNTLNDRPDAGVRDLDLLLARVKDDQAAPTVRAFALRLLPVQPRVAPNDGAAPVLDFPNGLTFDLLEQLLEVNDDTLSLEVIRTMAGNPIGAAKSLARIAADEQRSPLLRAEALAGLSGVADQHGDLLYKLVESPERVVREEALRALRQQPLSNEQQQRLQALAKRYADSADMYRAVLAPESLTTKRPKPEDTQAWLKLIDAVDSPVDLENGRRIFHHARVGLCANCHRHSGRGNVVGPDLSGLRDQDRTVLLQSILEPSRRMAPEYQPRILILNDGRVFTGIRLRSYTAEAIRDAHGQNRSFKRDDIESIQESNTSFMPTGLMHALTDRELRDLISFVESSGVSSTK